MSAVHYDTLKFSESLQEGNTFSSEQARKLSKALAEAMQDSVATRTENASHDGNDWMQRSCYHRVVDNPYPSALHPM